VRVGELLNDRQTQARADHVAPAMAIHAAEALEDGGQLIGGNADARVWLSSRCFSDMTIAEVGAGVRWRSGNRFWYNFACFAPGEQSFIGATRGNPLMSRARRCTLLLAVAALTSLTLARAPALAQIAAQDGPNLLINGGLEGQYVMQCSAKGGPPWVAVPCGNPIDFGTKTLWQTAQAPVGWTAWWLPPNENHSDPNFYNTYPNQCYDDAPRDCVAWHNPEYRDTAGGPQGPPYRKLAGDNSQKYFTFYSLHEAGLYQIVGGLQPGQRVRFSVYMQAWSNAENDAFVSAGQPSMGMRVGIDPYGDNFPWSPRIVWSPVKEGFDHWELFTVETVAQSDRVTVFTRSRPVFAIQHNDVYVDEASLVVTGSQPAPATAAAAATTETPTLTPSPSPTSRPTLTPFHVPTRTRTLAPTATFTPSAAPPPTSTPTAAATATPTLPAVFATPPSGSAPVLWAGGVIAGVLFVAFVMVRIGSSRGRDET